MKRILFQVYVTHSKEAVERYQEAFDAEIRCNYVYILKRARKL